MTLLLRLHRAQCITQDEEITGSNIKNDSTSDDADDPQTRWLAFTFSNQTYGIDVLHVQRKYCGVPR